MTLIEMARRSGHLGEIKGRAASICALTNRFMQSEGDEACILQDVIDEMAGELYTRYPFLKGHSITAISNALSNVTSREDAFAFDLIENGTCVKRYVNVDPRTLRIRKGRVVFGHEFEVGAKRYKLDADMFLRARENE